MATKQATLKRYEMLIDGELIASEKMIEVLNPSTEQVISEFPDATVEDVDRAVRAARRAFDSGPWRKMTGSQRSKLLWNRHKDGQ